MTLVLNVDPVSPDASIIALAADFIREGKVVVYPTDTVYGVGANALDAAAVLRIFKLKRRPLKNPLPVAVDGAMMAGKLATVTEKAQRLIAAFWPGALTLVLLKKNVVPDIVTAGHLGLALRAPNHKVPLKIIENSKVPLIATSANLHGSPSCMTAQEAANQIGDLVDLIIDGGYTTDTASTVLDLTRDRPRVLREGPVTKLMLSQALKDCVD